MLIDEAFAPHGPIATALPGFEGRPGQLQMARLIERGILEGIAHDRRGRDRDRQVARLSRPGAAQPARRSSSRPGRSRCRNSSSARTSRSSSRRSGSTRASSCSKGATTISAAQKYERMSAERLVAPSIAMEKLWQWAEHTTTGDRGELALLPARRRLGVARRRRRRLRRRVLLAVCRLLVLQAPRRGAFRRRGGRQPRAVLPRPRGRRRAVAGLRHRDPRRSAPVREVRHRGAHRDALRGRRWAG